MEYTKGDWEVNKVPDFNQDWVFAIRTYPEPTRRLRVADVWIEANAHLIAAAPELYEALKLSIEASKDAVSALNNLGESCPASVGLAAEKGRQALAKAEGN